MKSIPVSIRLEEDLLSLLAEGVRRTPFNRRELMRRTLRRHLKDVIEQEATVRPRLTNIAPWPRGALAKAYRLVDRHWQAVERAATSAQPPPDWND
jgi:hypothetical protein